MKSKKTESLEEFLARGGVIKVLPPEAKTTKEKPQQQASGGPAVILTLDQYDTYYGEVKTSKKKPKKAKAQQFDVFALPEHLRKKHLGRILEEAGLDEEDLKKT